MITLLTAAAFAGGVFVNGQQIDPQRLPKARMAQAEVLFDDSGNVFIMAPGFQVPPSALWVPPPPPPAPPAVSTVLQPRVAPMPAASPNGVPRARYWLATEDSGSAGHVIDLLINGATVATIRSGEPTRITDLAPHLRLGANEVMLRSNSTNATGGALYVYLGTGSDQSGTVVMDAPEIQFGVGKSRAGAYERRYTLDVPR
ncbi:MAG: hypothetical protein ACI8PZ_006305 [Myxococcota bacterium]|jgi:hypothetical protein